MTRPGALRWKPPHVVHRCAHCGLRTDRTAAAWTHGLVHGYGKVAG